MPTLRAYQSVDMLDTSPDFGRLVAADEEALVIRSASGTTFLYGEFRFGGNELKGTIGSIFELDRDDDAVFEIRGLDLGMKYLTGGGSPLRPVRKAFENDDRLIGSAEADRLAGFAGADLIRGRNGDDRLLGHDGADELFGGSGSDVLKGGSGRDLLHGGRGDDSLFGGEGRDVFQFGPREGRSVIHDFEDGRDKIAIDGAPSSLNDLEISYSAQGHARISFNSTEIVVRDGEDTISKGDFIFL